MVVVVNPRNQTLKIYRSLTDIRVLATGDTFEGQDVLPGFCLPVAKIFV